MLCTLQIEATKRARELFKELDVDGSGEIDKEEFMQGFLRAESRRESLIEVQNKDVPKVTVEHVE